MIEERRKTMEEMIGANSNEYEGWSQPWIIADKVANFILGALGISIVSVAFMIFSLNIIRGFGSA
jgi:hypothetical protein